jgi:dihydroorotate dehydrogenase (fumarate)
MDLTTRYLGLSLAHPFMPGASPMTLTAEGAARLEDAGASALVLHSLFEEDIGEYRGAADRYLELLLRLKRRVGIPLIASLNGVTATGWLKYAQLIEHAGASALELNFYHVATDPLENASTIESRLVDLVAVLKESLSIPLAVKLSPFFTALPHLAGQLDRIGVDGLVLFNRFLQPDIDPERCDASLAVPYSDSSDLLLRLRWMAILSDRIRPSLALSGGVHRPIDAVKAVLAGAHAVQIVSALLKAGPGLLVRIRDEFARWGDRHEYATINDMRGRANSAHCAHAHRLERGNYLETIRAAVAATASGVGVDASWTTERSASSSK